MKLIQQQNIHEFSQAALPFLTQLEPENSFMLSLMSPQCAGSMFGLSFFGTIYERQQLVAAAVLRGPSNLVISNASSPAVEALAFQLSENRCVIESVFGPAQSSQIFAELWSAKIGRPYRKKMIQRVYQLQQIIMPQPVSGRCRLANMYDLTIITQWYEAFLQDTGGTPFDCRLHAEETIANKQQYVWETNKIVSMGACIGSTPNGRRISFIFTPQECRGLGYASAITAAISQVVLSSGKRFCFLHTDLANPTSNSIYLKLGYFPVTDFWEHTFANSAIVR